VVSRQFAEWSILCAIGRRINRIQQAILLSAEGHPYGIVWQILRPLQRQKEDERDDLGEVIPFLYMYADFTSRRFVIPRKGSPNGAGTRVAPAKRYLEEKPIGTGKYRVNRYSSCRFHIARSPKSDYILRHVKLELRLQSAAWQ
jgi:hypothetical protein